MLHASCLQVDEIHLSFTVLKNSSNGRLWYPNEKVRVAPFINLTNSGNKGESFKVGGQGWASQDRGSPRRTEGAALGVCLTGGQEPARPSSHKAHWHGRPGHQGQDLVNNLLP